MRQVRHFAAVLAAAATLTLGAAGTAQAATPEIVDPAGDARTSLGVNVSEIDIRSVDVAVEGATLTYTIQVGAYPAFENRNNGYTVELIRPDGTRLYAQASNAPNAPGPRLGFGVAVLFDRFNSDPENPDPSIYSVGGTAAVDRATDRITLRFPVDAVQAETARTGVTVLGAAVSGSRADSIQSTSFRVIATDSAFGGPFTIGG